MGMFDSLICEYPLPGMPPSFIKPGHEFQTKSLDCRLDCYTITADGRMVDHPKITGTIDFYTDNIVGSGPGWYTQNGEDVELVGYRAVFVDGVIEQLRETASERKPALPIERMRIESPPDSYIDRRDESFRGKTLFVLWGGRDVSDGYLATVVAENSNQIVVEHDNAFEVLHRAFLGSTLFENEEDASGYSKARTDQWNQRRAEYDALIK